MAGSRRPSRTRRPTLARHWVRTAPTRTEKAFHRRPSNRNSRRARSVCWARCSTCPHAEQEVPVDCRRSDMRASDVFGALCVLLPGAAAMAQPTPAEPRRPALVVFMAVDQMRGDYLQKYGAEFT